MPKKLEDEKPKETSSEEQDALSKIMFMPQAAQEQELRTMTVMGDIDEEISKDIVSALWYLKSNASVLEPGNQITQSAKN